MNQTPKQVAEWAAYIEGVRNEAYEQGRQHGYTEGHKRGLEEATELAAEAVVGITELIKNKVSDIIDEQRAPQQPRTRVPLKSDADEIQWTGNETNRALVLTAVRAKPGMRPTEIVRWLQEKGANPNVNSILTTIKRLRDSEIEKRGDGWYECEPAEHAA